MAKLLVDKVLCTGCGVCINACLYDALELEDSGIVAVDPDKCTLCRACVSECPFDALSIDGGAKSKNDKEDYHGVWVYAEQWEGKINDVTFELLTKAKELADDLNEDLSAVLIGHNIDTSELIKYGAKNIYLLDDETLKIPNEETYAHLLANMINKHKPAVVLYGATAFGRSLAPRVAAKADTGLTADCTKLSIDKENKLLQQTRPAFGGNVMATIICPEHRPQMATVRPKVFKMEILDSSVNSKLINEEVNLRDLSIKSRILEVIDIQSKELRLEDSEIVVACGAGCSSKKTFGSVEKLAELLKGCVGASRAAVDLNLVDHSMQVGQTGKVISPKVYIACGIAGAIQHMVGMENADFIIGINNDPDATIFQVADIGIVGDMGIILPKLVQKIENYNAEQLAPAN